MATTQKGASRRGVFQARAWCKRPAAANQQHPLPSRRKHHPTEFIVIRECPENMTHEDRIELAPFDLISLKRALRICDLEAVLLDFRAPSALHETAQVDKVTIHNFHGGFPFRGSFTLPENWCLFGYIHHARTDGWCHGVPLKASTAFTVFPDIKSDFMLGADACLSLAILPFAKIERQLVDMGITHVDAFSLPRLFHLRETMAARRLRKLYQRLWPQEFRSKAPPQAADASFDIDIEQLLTAHLGASLLASTGDFPNCSQARRRHYLITQRTEKYMSMNLRNDIYINDICDAASVSERALRYAFDDLMHISPIRYLGMLRLCAARRSLILSDISRRSVKSVAINYGLRDLSRFADSYRRIFGELPHDTLMRSPPDENPIFQ